MADQNNEDVFLAEKVVDSGFGQQDGKRYYKIKWVRYTWESEDTVGHLKELLDVFWTEHGRLENAKTKATEDTLVEAKDPEKVESVEDGNISIADDNLAANATIEVDGILKNEDGGNEAQNTQMSDVVSTLPTHTSEHGITSTPHEEDDNFAEESKEVKYIMLEKHTCNICFRTYSSLQSLKTHKRSHQSDKSFQCETCFKCFSERSTLKRHMYIHLEEKPFKCDHCERAFSDKSTLRRHIITHTGAKRFQCTSCDKRFTRNEHLRQHNYIHTAQKLYKCDVCQKDFRQRSTLKNHMLLHRAEGGLKCEACGAVFSRQPQYEKHVRWCNGDTADGFKCEFCDKRFPERNGLKRHQLIHSGERPFKCEFCEQSFNDRSILRRHVYTHTDRKPFQCSLCQKAFIRKESLLSHMSVQHAEQSVFEFVHPAGYTLNDGLQIGDEELEKHVRYVIQSNTPTDVGDDSINQVEVSSNDIQNDGVTMLAHAVCNVPQNVLQDASGGPTLIPTLNEKDDDTQNQDGEHQTLRIQVGQESGIQTGENQLLQVQIIRMGDGNQFVQSIQAIVQDEADKSQTTLPLDASQVLDPNGELTITNEASSVMNDTMSGHLSISESINMNNDNDNVKSCVDIIEDQIDHTAIENTTLDNTHLSTNMADSSMGDNCIENDTIEDTAMVDNTMVGNNSLENTSLENTTMEDSPVVESNIVANASMQSSTDMVNNTMECEFDKDDACGTLGIDEDHENRAP